MKKIVFVTTIILLLAAAFLLAVDSEQSTDYPGSDLLKWQLPDTCPPPLPRNELHKPNPKKYGDPFRRTPIYDVGPTMEA